MGTDGSTPPEWVTRLRPLVPPAAPTRARCLRGGAIRFVGDDPSGEAAQRASDGYAAAAIPARVREAAARARDGRAAFERNGMTFEPLRWAGGEVAVRFWFFRSREPLIRESGAAAPRAGAR